MTLLSLEPPLLFGFLCLKLDGFDLECCDFLLVQVLLRLGKSLPFFLSFFLKSIDKRTLGSASPLLSIGNLSVGRQSLNLGLGGRLRFGLGIGCGGGRLSDGGGGGGGGGCCFIR